MLIFTRQITRRCTTPRMQRILKCALQHAKQQKNIEELEKEMVIFSQTMSAREGTTMSYEDTCPSSEGKDELRILVSECRCP